MQDTALELPTKMEISGCYQVKSIKKEIKYTLNLSILGPNGNACPMCCGKVVVKEGPFSTKLDIVKIEPKIEDSVWNSFWISAELVTDMTGVTIDKNGHPILTDNDLKNGDLLSKDSPTILTEKNYNSRIVVVVSLVKIKKLDNYSEDEYITTTYARIRRSEITTSLILHTVKNSENIEYKARDIFYNNQDSNSNSNSNSDDAEDSEDGEEDSDDSDDAEDSEDGEEDSNDSDDADDADDADDSEDSDDSDDADDMEDDSDNMDDKDPKQRSCCKD